MVHLSMIASGGLLLSLARLMRIGRSIDGLKQPGRIADNKSFFRYKLYLRITVVEFGLSIEDFSDSIVCGPCFKGRW